MSALLQDLRYGLRQSRKSPGFTAVAFIAIALGIGANTAIFSIVNGVLLRPLAFKDPDRLVRVWHVPPATQFSGIPRFAVSPANYLDWQRLNAVFDDMAIYGGRGLTLTGPRPEQVVAGAVSNSFFSTLGVKPRFWRDHFGSNKEIAGHDSSFDSGKYLVAGIMPESFTLPDFAEVWTPLGWTDQDRAVRGNHNYVVIARLKPGITVNQAQAEMNTISSRLAQLYPADDKNWGTSRVLAHRPGDRCASRVELRIMLVEGMKPTLLAVTGLFSVVALLVCILPAYRATKVDPIVALRYE